MGVYALPHFQNGVVQPYADSPMDKENIGEHVYLQILNQARDYVYINTPYLIVDDSMVSALTLTAKRGVDVRIVTPHIWDKRIVRTKLCGFHFTPAVADKKYFYHSFDLLLFVLKCLIL